MDLQVERLFKKARSGKAVLFLGAGASVGAGLPSGIELARRVSREFGTGIDSDDFIEVCTHVLNTAGINRADVEDFLRTQLDGQPSEAHNSLPLNRWRAIFTVNFDDLVETAYRNSASRTQRCEPVFSGDFSRRESDYMDLVRLFKLMGCVNGQGEESQMALSRTDYHRKLRRRGGLLRLVYDFAKDGTIIYAGYSFDDLIARDIIDEVRDEVGVDRLPWGWALLPHWDEDLEQLLRQRKVLPLVMTFEQFMDHCLATPSITPEPKQSGAVTLTVGGVPIDVPASDMKMYSREFQLLHDDVGIDDAVDSVAARRDYLEGKLDPWIGITRGWAFLRPISGDVEKLLIESLQGGIESEVPVFLLLGPAGVGKSTIARVVGHRIYRSQGIPTIFLHPENDQIDYVVIDSLSRQIEEALAAASQPKGRKTILIVIDEAAARIQHVRRLPQYLASRGIPALILAVARENEWGVARAEQPLSHVTEVAVSDTLDTGASESLALVRHLRGLEVLISGQEDSYWEARISREYDNSFATTLYQLAEPTRPPLTEAIRDEYENLSPLAKQAYRYVCTFYQFGIPIDLELLARSLGCSYERFIESVYDPATVGVIVEDVSETSDIRFRARSRLVAERIVAHVYGGETAWIGDVCSVIRACLPHNSNEVKTIRNMLIHRIGPRGAEPKDVAAVTQAFESAFDGEIRDSALLHHFALLLADQEQFDDADDYALRALAVIEDSRSRMHFKTESRQNLHNTLGMIAAKHGLKQVSVGATDRASELFEQAVTYFRAARTGEFANVYPFYSEAWMFYQRARSAEGIEAVGHIAQAFQVLDEAEGNVADEDMASISEMEAKLVRFLSEFQNLDAALQTLRGSEAPTAAYLDARYATVEGWQGYRKEEAYRIVTASLVDTPDHAPCLRLACNLHHALYPEDFSGWKAMLERLLRLQADRRQCSTLFSLGYAACQLGRYNEAQPYFEELEQESTGHPRRSRTVRVVRDGEENRRLTGRVAAVRSPTEGWLQSEEIEKEIKFIPRAQKFTAKKGDAVTYSLALNYRGFLAIDLRPA